MQQNYLTNRHLITTRGTRTPAGNSVYVAIAGEVVNRRSVFQRNFLLNGQVSASNPLLHIHAKRYQKDRVQDCFYIDIYAIITRPEDARRP